MRTSIKKIMMAGLLCLVTTITSAETLDKIVAIVNDNAITQSQLNAQMSVFRQQLEFTHAPIPAPAALRKQALQNMIDTQLQLQLAKKENITADDAKLNQAIAHIAQQNGLTLDQLKSKVTQQGMSYDKYRSEIQKQMIISELQQREVAPRVMISEQEVTDFLRQNGKRLAAMQTAAPIATTGQANTPALYHVIDILIPLPDAATQQQQADAMQKAKTILTKLRSGATVDVQSSDLGWRTFKDLPDIFELIVKNMQPGTVSDPIRAPNGYHLIQLAGVRGGAATPSAAPMAMPSYTTHVRHILIKTTPLTSDEDAKYRLVRIRDAIIHGADFSLLAKEDSQDPGSASKGGDLGWVNPGMLDPTFEKIMNGLKVGEISEPFKTTFGWHIAQVLERKSIAKDQDFLRTQAKAILYQRKYGETLQNWLQQLRSQSYVKIMDN